MSSRFDAMTSVIELPGIGPGDLTLLQRLKIFTWGDLVGLKTAAAVEELPRSQAGDVAGVDAIRKRLGLDALRSGDDLLPIDAFGGIHVFASDGATIREVAGDALRRHGLRSQPFATSTRPVDDLRVFTTLGPDRLALANEGGEWIALLSERLEGCPVAKNPLLPLLAPLLARGATGILAFRYIPDLFGTPPRRDLLLVCGDGTREGTFALRWHRGDDPGEMARALANVSEEPETGILAALADDEPFALARALGLEHLGFRSFYDETVAADEEPDVIEFSQV